MKELLKKIFAPFKILQVEKVYIFWIFLVVIFGLVNLWAGILMNDYSLVDEAIQGGIVYTFSISVCASLSMDLLSEFIINTRSRKANRFVTYRITAAIINFIWIIILCFIWTGDNRDSLCEQTIIGVISVVFSFYMYCVSKMAIHEKYLTKYDDKGYDYLEDENDTVQKNSDAQENLKETPGGSKL